MSDLVLVRDVRHRLRGGFGEQAAGLVVALTLFDPAAAQRVALVKALPGGQKNTRNRKQVSKREVIKLFRGLASMLKGNINTADALNYYAQGLPNPALQGDRTREVRRLRATLSPGLGGRGEPAGNGRYRTLSCPRTDSPLTSAE